MDNVKNGEKKIPNYNIFLVAQVFSLTKLLIIWFWYWYWYCIVLEGFDLVQFDYIYSPEMENEKRAEFSLVFQQKKNFSRIIHKTRNENLINKKLAKQTIRCTIFFVIRWWKQNPQMFILFSFNRLNNFGKKTYFLLNVELFVRFARKKIR